MINPVKWFQEKGFGFDDKITIKDVIELQDDAMETGIESGIELYLASLALMKNPNNKNCWHNLEGATSRWGAKCQAARIDAITNKKI